MEEKGRVQVMQCVAFPLKHEMHGSEQIWQVPESEREAGGVQEVQVDSEPQQEEQETLQGTQEPLSRKEPCAHSRHSEVAEQVRQKEGQNRQDLVVTLK
jgi:hypothetical protein